VLTPANIADSEPAPALLSDVPAEVRFVLGDRHYITPELHENCEQADRVLVTNKYGRYPHTDDGVEVRRVFHKLGSIAMENFNELIFGIFDVHGQVPDLWPDCYPTLCLGCHLCLSNRVTVPL
jgi:DDE family transposase